jgi:hypothetical protein
MALKVADRVRENTSTTGTGALTLSDAPDGYRTFSSTLSEGDNTYYTIEEHNQYEVGIGTFSSSVLERSFVLKSSNNNNKIELGGSGAVFITYPADKSVYRDQESQVVVDASGLLFSNATVVKDAKLTEFTDINSSGTPSSSHIMTFDFADQNLLIGDGIGNAASKSIILGDNSGNDTSANGVVIIGVDAATEGVSLINSVFIGSKTGPTRSDVSNAPYYSVVMGYNAADEARHESSIIGYKAGINSYSIGSTALGYFAGSGVGDYATSIGHQAGNNNTDDYTINIGYQAGYSAGGNDSIWVGRVAGYNSTAAVKSMGLGYAAGQSSSADNSIYLGVSAGESNTTDNMFFVANNTPTSNGSLIKGDIANKRVAIGVADVTLSDTLYVGINSANDVGVTVKAATLQAADLTQWQNSAGSSVASITNSGVMTVYGVHASGAGLQLDNITPAVTNNALYNVDGVLYWNGLEFTGVIDAYTSGNATYASGQALSLTYASGLTSTNQTNITAVTSTANYASGEAVSLTYASGLTVTNAANISTVTPTANYASGQALSLTYASGLTATNQTNISTATAVANYASGQVNITTDGTAEASKALILDSAKTFTGVKDGVFNEFDSLVKSSGLIVGNSGVVLSSSIPSVTANTLYNDAGTLSWNGSAIGGGASATATYASGQVLSLTYASGLTATNATNITTATSTANYASGQALSVAYASGLTPNIATNTSIASYASGQALSLTYASGLTATNASNITTVTSTANYASGQSLSLSHASGVTTSLVNSSGIATYASGQALSLTYASGLTATNSTNITSATSTANYASGQAIENEGLVAYASGNTANIAFGSNAEGDMLYHNGVNFVRLAKGTNNYILKMDGNVPNWEAESSGGGVSATDFNYVSGAAAYSSGVVTGGIPNFNVIGVNTGSPEYGVDVTGGGASGVIQATGIILGASGVIFSNGTTQTVAGAPATVTLTAGDGLTGGGTLASDRTFAVGAGTLIDVQAGQVDVDLSEAAAATITHGDNLIFLDGGATGTASKGSTDDLANLLAGDGLTKSNSVMAVNVDDSTIETDSDAIRVKDNGITLAKMAGLARGKIIYGDSSGDPAALTAGGANTVLKSDGTDVSWGSVPVNSYVSGIAAYASGQALSLTYASGLTVTNSAIANYASGQSLSLTHASGLTATNAGNITTVTATANYASGQALSLATASGIAAYSSGVVTGGIANLNKLGINTGSPAYGIDAVGAGASGLIQSSGILIGASGIGVGTTTPVHPIDVVQHSGVVRASGMHSAISMNADAATVIFDLDQATTHGVTLGDNRTLALSNVQIGDKFLIRLQQDGTGSRTVTWFDHISWAGGSAPTLTTTENKADLLGFLTASGTGGAYWFDGLVVGQNI